MHQNALAAGLRPDPLGELKRSPRPPSREQGVGKGGGMRKGREGREGKEREREGREKERKEGKGCPPNVGSTSTPLVMCMFVILLVLL